MHAAPLRLGMIGGGRDAFIGGVHRTAARLDGQFELVAGALSASPEKARRSGRELGLAERRNYESWQALLQGEAALPAEQRVQLISIVTPNASHFEIAAACVRHGFAVACDKPLTTRAADAQALQQLVRQRDLPFCVTYNYSGYPMVKEARHLVRSGALGSIRKIIVEYNQGWLAAALEATGQKQAAWRTDPQQAGAGGAIGDIGSHAEQLVSYVTGLELEALCADLSAFVPGRALDDDANVLLRFTGGARGLLCASQVCIGAENDLRLRVWGEHGGLDWRQEQPNALTLYSADQPERVLRRGSAALCEAARRATRIPAGHPEAFIEAFANVYRNLADAIRTGAGALGPTQFDFPGVDDGLRGVQFIEAVVNSSRSDKKWTRLPPQVS